MASAKPGVHILTLDRLAIDERLLAGEKFLKWTDQDQSNSPVPVTLRVDKHGFFLHWKDGQKNEVNYLDMSQIRDVRTGRSAKVPKDSKLREVSSDPNKTVTVVYGTDYINTNFINFCTTKKEVAELWHDELLKITTNVLAANISSLYALHKIYTQITLLTNSDGKILVKNIVKLFAQNKEDRRLVEKALDASGLPSTKHEAIDPEKMFPFPKFFDFYTRLVQRTEVEKVFNELCQAEKTTKVLTLQEFIRFVNGQRDPRLNEILYPFCSEDKGKDIIVQNEPNPYNAERFTLSFEGFLRYLLSEENQVVASEYFDLHDDMDQPMAHYFINSSHNTYLTGHQWTGKSSVEMYRQVLLAGCRCIELDLWDGRTKDEEPVIVHGYTLVPEINAKDVIIAIAESAFKTSDYPVILSFENHCRPRQQAKIAHYCRQYFGDMLLSEPLESNPLEKGVLLPSPNMLKRKILIKNKKKHAPKPPLPLPIVVEQEAPAVVPVLPVVAPVVVANGAASAEGSTQPEEQGAEVDSADSDSDEDPDPADPAVRTREPGREPGETKAGEEISALVNYVQAVRFHNFEHAEKRQRYYEMSSFDEATAISQLKEHPIEFVKYNRKQISRLFPKGTRVDSSNFMPQAFWNAGCQLVALNYQTLDLPMQLNLGIFERNKKCGYLLKPAFMTRDDRTFDPFADTPVDGIVPATVSVQILSGQFLTDRHVGTYVDVDMFGLPCDTIRRKFRTKVVPNNGISPVFTDEPFVFKQVVLPALAVIRITAYEESGRFIGHRVLPVSMIRPGYRHISLRSESGQYLTFPTLFVLIRVQDYVPDRYSDLAEALANPIRYQTELERRDEQLKVFDVEMEEDQSDSTSIPLPNKSSDVPTKHSPGKPPLPTSGAMEKKQSISMRTSPQNQRNGGVMKDQSLSQLQTNTGSPEMKAEGISSFLAHKTVEEKMAEYYRKLNSLQKKYEKEFEKLHQTFNSKEEKAQKFSDKASASMSRKLVKTFSERVLDRSSSQSEDHDIKLSRLKKTRDDRLRTLSKEREDKEKELAQKYHAQIWSSIEKLMRTSQCQQMKLLETLYEREKEEAMKKIELQAQDEIREPKEKDKDEIIRFKRERRDFIVKRGIVETQRLQEAKKFRQEELERQHLAVREEFVTKKEATRHGKHPTGIGVDEGTSSDIEQPSPRPTTKAA